MGDNHTEYHEKKPTITVLMAVYRQDRSKYLDGALNSVWEKQTLKPNQIVLVEDGPLSDSLKDIISRWKTRVGDALVLCRNKERMGLTKCLNTGLQHVTTTFVARMDSDDISTPSRFEQQVRYLLQHPETDIVGGAIQEFNDDNECLYIRHYPLTHDKARQYLLRACPLSHPAVMMRMEIFRRGLTYDERFPTSQDIALWFDAVSRGFHLGNLDDIVLFYRREKSFYKRRSKTKARNECLIYLRGIYRLKGLFTTAYVYPLARYCFRRLPIHIIKMIYGSWVRTLVLKQ